MVALRRLCREFNRRAGRRLITSLLIPCWFWIAPPNIDISKVSTLVGALITVAGVVVTVFGIWIAVIYPGFTKGLRDGATTSSAEGTRYRALLSSLYRSGLVLCLSTLCLFLLTFYSSYAPFFPWAIGAFCALSLVSISESLWEAICSGDSSANDSVNRDRVAGSLRNRRRR